MTTKRGRTPAAALALAMTLGGCATVTSSSLLPEPGPGPNAVLAPPPGYSLDEQSVELPSLGRVHVVRLDNPGSEATLIYSGSDRMFVAGQTERARTLAAVTGADIILYDYPGRGGTTVMRTFDALSAAGPALVASLREMGWIGSGALVAYGYGFGGGQAAAMARGGGFDGLIIEASAADLRALRRNRLPGLARPLFPVLVKGDVRDLDYVGDAAAADAPVLLLSSRDNSREREEDMQGFYDALRERGVEATIVTLPGERGDALLHPGGVDAVQAFLKAYAAPSGPP